MKVYSTINGLNRFLPTRQNYFLRWKYKSTLLDNITPSVFKRGYIRPSTPTPSTSVTPTADTITTDLTPDTSDVVTHPPYSRKHYHCNEAKYNLLLPHFPPGNLYDNSNNIIAHGSKIWIKAVNARYSSHVRRLDELEKLKTATYNGTLPEYLSDRNMYIIALQAIAMIFTIFILHSDKPIWTLQRYLTTLLPT